MALATTSVSADDVKSLLALAERDYRLSNFGSAFSKTKRIIQSESFRSLQPKKQHEAAKACIKYAFCNNSQTEILEWLKEQGDANLAHQGLYVCEWVACSLDRGGSSYQQHTQLKNAEIALKDVYMRASGGTDREAQLTRDMVAELLLQKVMLPHTDAHSCARWLNEHSSQLSPSVKTELEAAVQAKIVELEARRKPVVAARATAAASKSTALTPAKVTSSTSWLYKTYNDYVSSLWNDKQNWKYAAGVVVAFAVLYSLFVERKGIQQAPSREGAGSGNSYAGMLQDAELGR